MTLGRFFLEGKTPYADYFDHKGPVLFFIEAFGLMLHPDNRTAIFFLEVISLFCVQWLLFRIARLFLNVPNSLAVIFICLSFFGLSIREGNLTEEYSLPFILVVVFFTLRNIAKDIPLKRSILFLMGVCAAIPFWMRANNMGLACACLLLLFIARLNDRDWAASGRLVLFGILGFASVTVLLVLYFAAKGALDDMLYATILFNLKYNEVLTSGGISVVRSLNQQLIRLVVSWLPFAALAFGALAFYRRNKNHKYLLLSSLMILVGYICTHLGAKNPNYMTLNIPCLMLGVIFIIVSFSGRIRHSRYILAAALVLLLLTALSKYPSYRTMNSTDYISEANSVKAKIPYYERNSVFGYNVPARFWVITQLTPCYKYYFNQWWHSRIDRSIAVEIKNMLNTRPPAWLLIDIESINEPGSEYIKNIAKERYSLYYETKTIWLYRKKNDK
jgi:hypothetical protein